MGSKKVNDPNNEARKIAGERSVGTEATTDMGHRSDADIRGANTVDRTRIAAIKKDIAKGRYHVDADRVAQKIIELENQL